MLCGNQQPSPDEGKVQRLERKLVALSKAKWGASLKEDEDIVWSYVKA